LIIEVVSSPDARPVAWKSADVEDDVVVDEVEEVEDVDEDTELAIATCLQSTIGPLGCALKARRDACDRPEPCASRRAAEAMQVRLDADLARVPYNGRAGA
jgi:hypothetical protein